MTTDLVHLKIYNNAIHLIDYKDKVIHYRMLIVNEDKIKNNPINDTVIADGELAHISILNEVEYEFKQQSNDGRLYNGNEFVIFRSQLIHAQKTV